MRDLSILETSLYILKYNLVPEGTIHYWTNIFCQGLHNLTCFSQGSGKQWETVWRSRVMFLFPDAVMLTPFMLSHQDKHGGISVIENCGRIPEYPLFKENLIIVRVYRFSSCVSIHLTHDQSFIKIQVPRCSCCLFFPYCMCLSSLNLGMWLVHITTVVLTTCAVANCSLH